MEWYQYLKLPHEEYNCLTLIEKICLDQGFKIQGLDDMLQYHFKYNWGTYVSYEQIDHFIKINNGKLVTLQDVKEFDIILFNLRETRPQHFGVYIGLNKFIHHRKYFKIDELEDSWRNRIKYIIRWKNI